MKPKDYTHDSACDFWLPAANPLKGVLLLVHGLNLKPEKMKEMAQEFSMNGFDVFIPAFYGHCGKGKDYLNVSADYWQEDARAAYASASFLAKEKNTSLFLVAYSLGALIFEVMADELPFAKRIYFAPPLAMHYWYRPLQWFAKAFPDFSFRSRNLSAYRVNDISSFRSILALHYFYKKWNEKKQISPATLIWIDPADELVSASGLAALNKNNDFQLNFISNKETLLKETYHHLVITKESIGISEWSRVILLSKLFLNP